MTYGSNAQYAALVAALRDKYRARGEVVARLIETGDADGIRARAAAMKARLASQLLDPDLDAMTPFEAHSAGVLRYPGYTIEKVWIAGAGGAIPVNYYCPDDSARHPAVVVTIGHWLAGKAQPDDQRLCANLALHGIAALTLDPIYQGERLPYTEGELRSMFGDIPEDMQAVGLHMRAGNPAYMLGKNIGALFVHEARRALDWLCARPEIDSARIGACGQSGGGTLACYLAALDDRVAAFAPVQCLSKLALTLEGGIGDCEQSLSRMSAEDGMEQCDLLWAALPKPVMHSAGRDDYFAVEGVYAIQAEMNGVYRVLGKPGDYELRLADCGHELSAQSREHLLSWFAARFGAGEAAPEVDTPILSLDTLRVLPPDQTPRFGAGEVASEVDTPILSLDTLRVLPTDQAPRFGAGEAASEVDTPHALTPDRAARTPLICYRDLLERARMGRPQGEALREAVRALIDPIHERYTVETLARTRTETLYQIVTADSRAAFCRLRHNPGSPLTLVIAPGDFELPPDIPGSALYAAPWGMEAAYAKDTLGYDLETCLFNAAHVLGEHIAAQRVRQLIAVLDHAASTLGDMPIRVVGVSAGALPALLLSLIDPRVTRCVLLDGILDAPRRGELCSPAATYALCDDPFETDRAMIHETNILPNLPALATFDELCNLANAVCVSPTHAEALHRALSD